MKTMDDVKQSIRSMLPEDKNGLILQIVQILYADCESGELDMSKEWTGETIEYVARTLEDAGIVE